MNQRVPTADNSVLSRLCESWLNRAAIRSPEYIESPKPTFVQDAQDFPPGLIPFRCHPVYERVDPETKQRVESLAWIAWNMRVVDTEELVVGKSLGTLLSGGTDLRLSGNTRIAIRHTLIDEYFHSHMHETAVGLTCQGRGISRDFVSRLNRPGATSRSYSAFAAELPETWQKDLARLTWTVVGELSIYEFLTLVSSDTSIQPASRKLLHLHEKDEAAHASVIAQVMQEHFHEFSPQQREFFVNCLPRAIQGFCQEDWPIWQDILELAGVREAAEIIEDMKHDRGTPDQLPLTRSYQRIQTFCDKVGVELRQIDA